MNLAKWPSLVRERYRQAGLALKDAHSLDIRRKIETFLSDDASLDGSAMQSNWFPLIAADIFISHSHLDVDLALTAAGWLSERFGLQPFIDSCV